MSVELKDLNLFDIASAVLKFVQSGALIVEHEAQAVASWAVNCVNGKVVLSTKSVEVLVSKNETPTLPSYDAAVLEPAAVSE